jgi:hypothetical protein
MDAMFVDRVDDVGLAEFQPPSRGGASGERHRARQCVARGDVTLAQQRRQPRRCGRPRRCWRRWRRWWRRR